MKLHDLHPASGSRKTARRVGRGHGSGRGKTAGRGQKGQKSRAGGNLPAWFEGGQTPLHVRTPKLHGFKNRFRVEYAPVNLARLAEAKKGTLLTPDVLAHDGLVRDTKLPIKVLGNGDAPAGVTIHAHAFSRAALDKLSAAGSTAQRISWPENLPVDETPDTADAEAKGKKGRARRSASTDEDAPSAEAPTAESLEDAESGVSDNEDEASESEPRA
ncbi:MAG: 50S ribosomal protein L15 [Candidatus Limnocylindria bacterium]